ncbi:MAG: DUF58 domain-containing protein, partial [Pseudomonadota bacterium]
MHPGTASLASRLRSAPTALLQRLEWRARHAVNTTVSGEYRSAFRGRGMEFDQVVRYQWGDDPRDIDWNVTARLGAPYRKRFVEERDLSVIFVFEDAPALQFGSDGRTRRDTLLEAVALLMLVSGINRDRVGLLYRAPSASWFVRARPGRAGALRCAARLLAAPAPALDGPPSAALPWDFMRRFASRGSVLVWAGPFAPTELPRSWPELQHRYQLVGMRADDPWDDGLPEDARLVAYDPVAGWLTTLDGGSAADRAAHARWRAARESHFAALFPNEDDRLRVRNTEDPLQALVAWFHRHRHAEARG